MLWFTKPPGIRFFRFRLTVVGGPGVTKKITVSATCADVEVEGPELVAEVGINVFEVRLVNKDVVSAVNEVSDAAAADEESCREEVGIVNGVVAGGLICSVAEREVPRERLSVPENPSVGFVESPMVVFVDRGASAIEVEFGVVSSPVEPAAAIVVGSR